MTHYVSIAAGAPLTFLILDTGIGLLFVGVGTVAWRRRPTSRTGPLLVLSGALWSLGSYGPTGFVPVWALGFAFEGYYDVALALLALTFPADRLSRVGRAAMWRLAGGFALRSIGRLLLQDPPRTYPDDFPSGDLVNPFAVLENRAAFETVEVLANAAIAALAIVVAFVAVRRLLRSSSLTRSVICPSPSRRSRRKWRRSSRNWDWKSTPMTTAGSWRSSPIWTAAASLASTIAAVSHCRSSKPM